MRKVTVSGMRERYAQAVLTFRVTYVQSLVNAVSVLVWRVETRRNVNGTQL